MAQSSILGIEPDSSLPTISGSDEAALGPSDISDTGSDVRGAPPILRPDFLNLDNEAGIDVIADSDTDSTGTGEGLDATGHRVESGGDIAPDRIMTTDEFLQAEEDRS